MISHKPGNAESGDDLIRGTNTWGSYTGGGNVKENCAAENALQVDNQRCDDNI